MRKVAILLVGLMSLCMISGTVSAKGTKAAAENVTGKVVSVMTADPAKGMKPTVTVADRKGEKTVFEITSTTTLYGADMKPITLKALNKDASVKVKGAMIKEGSGVATSIRLLK